MKPIDFDRETLRRAVHATADILDRTVVSASDGAEGAEMFVRDVLALSTMHSLFDLTEEFLKTIAVTYENDGTLAKGAYDDLLRHLERANRAREAAESDDS